MQKKEGKKENAIRGTIKIAMMIMMNYDNIP